MRLTRLRQDDRGATAAIAFIVATAVLTGALVLAQTMVSQPAAIDQRTALYDAEAAAALEVIVRDAGQTTLGGAWAANPDAMSRFGLALAGQPNFIDYVKVRALRNGSLQDLNANQAPDYPEVRRALGLQTGDFHLRTYPVLPDYTDPRWTKYKQPVAYFGHYSAPTVPVVLTPTTDEAADHLNVTLQVKNVGTKDAVFVASVSLTNAAGKKDYVTETRHTPLVPPGGTATVWVRFDRLSAWEDDIDKVHVVVTDPYRNVAVDASGNVVGDFFLDKVPPAGGTRAYGHRVHAGSDYYHVGGPAPTFWLRDHDGDGDHVNNAKGVLVVHRPDGTVAFNSSVVDIPRNGYKHECAACTAVGNYTVVGWDKDLKVRHVDVVHVSARQMFDETLALDPIAVTEVNHLSDLIASFDPTRYDAATNPGGDVFGDESNGPSELTSVLANYTLLIIGSEVKQTALTPATTKRAIADWVQAGGNLVVLGTKKQVSEWLEPIYSAAQINANGGISAPDPTHPILVSPNRLDYQRYLDRGRAWEIDDDQPFTHALNRGRQGNSYQDTLAVNAPGSLGNGTVVLTSYMAGALTDPQDGLEAKKFLTNLISQSYTMLFLDYGPPIPDGVPVGSAQRLVAVPHPNVPGAVVEVKMVMYVFG